MSQPEERPVYQARIPPSLAAQLQTIADQERRPLNNLIIVILEQYARDHQS